MRTFLRFALTVTLIAGTMASADTLKDLCAEWNPYCGESLNCYQYSSTDKDYGISVELYEPETGGGFFTDGYLCIENGYYGSLGISYKVTYSGQTGGTNLYFKNESGAPQSCSGCFPYGMCLTTCGVSAQSCTLPSQCDHLPGCGTCGCEIPNDAAVTLNSSITGQCSLPHCTNNCAVSPSNCVNGECDCFMGECDGAPELTCETTCDNPEGNPSPWCTELQEFSIRIDAVSFDQGSCWYTPASKLALDPSDIEVGNECDSDPNPSTCGS